MTMFSMAGNTPDRTLSLIYADGDTATIPESHNRFDELVKLVLSGADDAEVIKLVDIMLAISLNMVELSERVSIRGRTVLFDGDPLRGELADTLVEIFESGNPESLRPIVNFLEKAATNPSRQSVDELYRWITKGSMIIHEDGDFLAYKGVQLTDGERFSITAGSAFVNGEAVTGFIPNEDGDVVTMPRSDVDDNKDVACSTGLHAGTYEYAVKFLEWNRHRTFDVCLVLTKINPRDVVSTPTDELDQKLRVCRYVVQEGIEVRRESRLYMQETLPIEEEELDAETETLGFIPPEEDLEEDFEEDDDDEDEDFEALSEEQRSRESEEALETLRLKLMASDFEYSVGLSEAELEAEEAEQVIRDSKGRFTSESAVKAVRNAKGQFTKQS